MREQIIAYGRPDRHVIVGVQPHCLQLEWRGELLNPTISLLRRDEWTVREDWELWFATRSGAVSLPVYRRLLDDLHDRLSQVAAPKAFGDPLELTKSWVAMRQEALAGLDALVGGVP